MHSFSDFLLEGGNVKIGGISSVPTTVTAQNRAEKASDIHHTLEAIHNSFHAEHNKNLFGSHAQALKSGSAYSGSTRHLMNPKISHEEYARYKPKTGDVDVQIPKEHKDLLHSHLRPGKRFGKYTVLGTSKRGTETSAIMKHDNGEHHQFDFEHVTYHNGHPTKGDQFLHSASWIDTKHNIKGMHHKALLSNLSKRKNMKFSTSYGLRDVNDTSKNPGKTTPEEIAKTLFNKNVDVSKIHSFVGTSQLIKKHIPKEQHQELYNHFKSGLASRKNVDNNPPIEHLRKVLGVKNILSEETEKEHHTTVIPLSGFSPISHMGHAHDLGEVMKKLPGTKHIGISAKSTTFTPEERINILKRQWQQDNINHHISSSPGETVAKAYHTLPQTGTHTLHILVGTDRQKSAEHLKDYLEKGKVKEMEGSNFDHIHIHYPENIGRKHGLSGTNMRTAALHGDYNTFSKHLGPMFSKTETNDIMGRVRDGIISGKDKIKRLP